VQVIIFILIRQLWIIATISSPFQVHLLLGADTLPTSCCILGHRHLTYQSTSQKPGGLCDTQLRVGTAQIPAAIWYGYTADGIRIQCPVDVLNIASVLAVWAPNVPLPDHCWRQCRLQRLRSFDQIRFVGLLIRLVWGYVETASHIWVSSKSVVQQHRGEDGVAKRSVW